MQLPDLNNIPAKGAVIGLLGATTIVGAIGAWNPHLAGLIMFGMLLLALATAKFIWISSWLRKRKAQSMASELNQQSANTPAGISDKPQIEKLDGLRKNFLGGLEKFRAAGKDLYKLPWYVIIGEPGAGKTEVIRHCDVGFPPGMQEEEFMGVGGTINMNWWFTNRAIILDTAGRLLFEKVPAGSTGEWKEFLKLLRKHRPNCPVNGLLLAIPADSLIRDSDKKIEERAGWIARQLDTIQRELDIRFPVYVIITKCDLLNGFREFFDGMDSAEQQRQMLGWSNPEPIDQPYRPEQVEQHLHMVVARLRDMRLKLLEDPVARDASKRRTDEVDRPYAFPHSISLIGENLRKYLSTIFTANEWSPKPLFLRGIYFTSSLQEGSELDQELANAIGMPVDELPAGGAWKRETTFFLRDLFLEKIFPEWGLVTRATNTRKLLRKRLLAVLGTGLVALTAISLLSWLGYKSMKDSIGRQSGYWLRASEGWDGGDRWMPIVAQNEGKWEYNGDKPVGKGERQNTRDLFDGGDQSLVNFHARLKTVSVEPLRISPIFRPFYKLAGSFDEERKRAQRIVLEGSVVKPLLESTRTKIITAEPDPRTGQYPDSESAALLGLIRVEAGIVKRGNGSDKIAAVNTVLEPLLTYTAGTQNDYLAVMPEVINWTYSPANGTGKWPANWMTGGSTLTPTKPGAENEKLVYNQAIDVGIEHMRINCAKKFESLRARWDMIQKLITFLQKDYEKKEGALWQASATAGMGTMSTDDPMLQKRYKDFLDKNVVVLDQMLVKADEAQLFGDGQPSLLLAYQRTRTEWNKLIASLIASIDDPVKELAFAETQGAGPSLLLKEIRKKLEDVRAEIQQGTLPEMGEAELRRLDSTYLTTPENRKLAYKERSDLYALSFATTQAPAPAGPWLGTKFAAIETVKAMIDKARAGVYAYKGESTQEFRTLCDYWLSYAQRRQIDACFKAYLVEAKAAMSGMLHFPLVWPPEETTALTEAGVLKAAEVAALLRADLRSKIFTDKPENQTPSPARVALEKFEKNLRILEAQINALVITDQKRMALCRISMQRGPKRAEAVNPPIDPITKLPMVQKVTADLAYEFRLGTFNSKTEHRSLGGKVTVGNPVIMIDKLPLSSIFHAHCWYATGGGNYAEVKLGNNWVILRMLADKKAESTDGIHWVVNMAEKDGDYPVNQDIFVEVDFYERPVPPIASWPKKEMFLIEE